MKSLTRKSIIPAFLIAFSVTVPVVNGFRRASFAQTVLPVPAVSQSQTAGSPILAQACGGYGIYLTLTDESGKDIRGVIPRIVPLGNHTLADLQVLMMTNFQPDPQEPKRLVFELYENGGSLTGDYTLRITSLGYLPYDQVVQFPVCKRQAIEVKLKRRLTANP